MITIRKLRSLPPGTRHRKAARLLESWLRTLRFPDPAFLRSFLADLCSDKELARVIRDAACGLLESDPPLDRVDAQLLHEFDALRGHLLAELGLEPAEWDLAAPEPGPESPSRGLASVSLYLESIRSPFNLGSILRTANAFGVQFVGASPDCPQFDHPRVLRSAMGSAGRLELVRGSVDAVIQRSGSTRVVALETGGVPLRDAVLPERAVVLVGSEELGLSPALLDRADLRLSIPMPGAKASINVGVAVGIALSAWTDAMSGLS
jgi:TrmH family RNA methyltransferase